MEQLFNMFIFCVIASLVVAKLEINIEGSEGWAKNLPTWRIKNRLTRLFVGNQYFTGYHFWLIIVLLTFLQFPFFIGVHWGLSMELKIIGMFWLAVLMEDFFWFLLNPSFGIKKFNKKYAYWHLGWIGFIPTIYFKYFFLTSSLLLLSYFV